MKFDTILAGTDFSPPSTIAIRQALRIARHLGSRLVLAHARGLTESQPLSPETSLGELEAFRQDLRQEVQDAHEELAAERQRFLGQGVDVSQIMVDLPPEFGLLRAAEEMGAALVVVGSHGRTGLRRVLLGSVSERVVRASPFSVLVAREPVEPGGFRSLLVPIDFGPQTSPAVEAALLLAAPGARVDLLHAIHAPAAAYGTLPEGSAAIGPLLADLREDAAGRGAALAAAAGRGARCTVEFRAIEGSPRDVILEELNRQPRDLLVIGSRGLRGAKRLLLGSTAETAVRHAPCSALVVHG